MSTTSHQLTSGAHKNALVIFVKAPIAGQVKTRLASAIGDEAAVSVYRLLVEHVVISVHEASDNYDVLLYADSEAARAIVATWLGENAMVQQGVDLGDRLTQSFAQCFESYTSVVVIGSDAPFVSPLIGEAFKALEKHDCVIGPAFDGGYYLIGLNRAVRNWSELFADISWSTSLVFVETVRNAREAAIDVHVLPAMHDIDTISDMRSIIKAFPDASLVEHFEALLREHEVAETS